MSFTDTLGVKIIDENDEIKSLTEKFNYKENFNITILYSSFYGNSIDYQSNLKNIAGIFYFESFMDIFISNSTFYLNQMNCSSTALKRIGGTCINSISTSNRLFVQNSLFMSNSARFQSNCATFFIIESIKHKKDSLKTCIAPPTRLANELSC